MQKGKHQGGQTQGYPPRNYSTYPGNPENARQYSRGEVPAFHAGGTPGGGPGMRGMHHAPPNQPPTPPTSQDIKQQPAHLPQTHQMPPQSGGPMMTYPMPGTGRGGTQQTPFYNPTRAPPSSQRIAPHARPSVVMSSSAQSFMPQQVVQPVYQGHMLSTQMSGQGPMFVSSPMSQPFQLQQPRHQSGTFYQTQQILLQQHPMFTPYPQQTMYYSQPLQTMSRGGAPGPTSQGGAPAQTQPPLALIASHGGSMISNPGVSQVKTSRVKKVLDIIDPKNGRNILDDMNENDNTSSRSGESSARQTPQPPVTLIDPNTGRDVINDFKNENSSSKLHGSCERTFPQPQVQSTVEIQRQSNAGQKTDQGVAADFATRVAIAARSDHSGSPNAALQQSSSRTSNYSESESQASPDPQGMSTPSVSPSKLDTSVDSISSENQIVENNITYDSNQQTPLLRGNWTPMIAGGHVDILPMSIHAGMMIADPCDMMRGGPLPNQPREYQAVQAQWITEGNPVPVIINKEPPAPIESPVRPTPVVSALAHGPTVEIGPRPQREHFPALGKGHQQQSPVKRKQRSEQTQEQGDGKVKEQQFKTVTQTKPKSVTPTVESKKQQPTQPSQDSEEYVQSVQTKNNEPKTIIIKKNDSDSSGTKNKSNDSLKNKESNNLETRNLNEEIVQDNNNRNKSENAKFDVPVTKENSSPTPNLEESTGKIIVEEAREKAPSVPIPVSEAEPVPPAAEESASSKANGETTEEEAKSNNQKSKAGNKRPAQSKMRLESKDSRTAEPEAPAIEVTPSAPPVPDNKNSAPSTAATNEQLEKAHEDTAAKENVEKENENLLVATKNEENAKQTTSAKENDASNAPTAPNKVVLKHNYEAGQWSPLNPEGKKKYDRQFIMDLQNEPQSLRKPLNLPSLEILNDIGKQRPFDRNVINSMSRSHVDSLYPSFANKNSSQRGGQAITKRGSQQGKPKAAKPAVVQVSLQQDVKLHETENAWKPTRNSENTNKSEEEAKTEELYRRVRGILNKLTPEKFEVLVRQVKELPIDNPVRLDGVIDLVFKKAVDEPSFSVAYAQMCSVLQRMEVPSDNIRPDGKPEPVNFRNLLIGKCQQEFEKNTAAELKRDERLREIDEEKDPEKKKVLQLSFEEEERKIRMRSVGNIRFIGELYKMHMLTCGIMHSCINQLLNQGDEESLECLCKLLTTIGQGLESKEKATKASIEKGKVEEKSLNNYFKKLELIVKNKRSGRVSSRVRFMIQDLIDLRNNKWVPRRNESQPKTIEQIQKEAERENIEMMNLALNSHRESNKRQDMRNSLDNRKRGGADSGGWTTVSQQKSKSYFIEYDKLKLDQSDVEGVSLGNRTQFIWVQGGSRGKSDDRRSVSQLDGNPYALLSTPSSGYSSLKGSSEKDRMNSYKAGDDEVVSSKNSNQQDSRSSSRESASSKRDEKRFVGSGNKGSVPPSQPPAPEKDDSKDSPQKIIKKSNQVLNDYLTSMDVNEVEDLSALSSPSSYSCFVTYTMLEAMERRGSNLKHSVGLIMNHYIKGKQLSKEDFLVGLSKVLETGDDLALDMPLVWTYIAENLVVMVAEEVITFKDLVSAVTLIKGSSGSLKLLTELMSLLIKAKGIAWVEQKWLQSQVQLTDFIDENDIHSFLEKNNVDFILKDELTRLITAKASFDDITDWIRENVGEDKSSKPSFVKILMTVLLEASVTKGQSVSYKLDTDFFSHYEQLIVRYTNHLEELELPCLLAIQAFVHKLEYPPTILHTIFNHLWDGGLIAVESFKLWRDLKDSNEQEGHAVCVKSLTSFFTHLNESETEDES